MYQTHDSIQSTDTINFIEWVNNGDFVVLQLAWKVERRQQTEELSSMSYTYVKQREASHM